MSFRFRSSTSIVCWLALAAGFVACSSDDSTGPGPPPPEDAQWRWMEPAAQGATLSDIWGPSADNLFATGAGGVVMRFDGTTWTRTTTPTASNLNGIWGTSASHAVVVGDDGVILVFDGTDWTPQESGVDDFLLDVWGTSATDVFAVGLNRTVLHYDGSSWSTMTTQALGPGLGGVWGISSTDVYATGLGHNLFHFDGGNWTEMTTPATHTLTAIWGDGGDIVAVGILGAAIYFDGVQWTPINVVGSSPIFSSVWGANSSDVYSVGLDGQAYHWDGGAWSPLFNRSAQTLNGVFGADGRVFAVGDFGTIQELASGEMEFAAGGFTRNIQDVWMDNGGNAFAVGDAGTILRWQSGAWETMESGTTKQLRAVYGPSYDDLIAVGREGVVSRFDGVVWSTTIQGPGFDLYDVWTLDNGTSYAVGAGGLILRSQGAGWVDASAVGVTDSLLGVWAPSPDHVCVVGAQSRALVWNGLQWKLLAIDASRINNYHSVHGLSADDFYVGAEFLNPPSLTSGEQQHKGGLIYHWDGTSWTIVYQDQIHDILSVWVAGPEQVFATGDASSILFGSSAGFRRLTDLSGLPLNVNSVWGASASDVLVVGDNGTIARYSR